MPSVWFSVAGVEGQRRPRASVMAGRAHVRKDDADRAREELVRAAFVAARDAAGLPPAPATGPVTLHVLCSMPLPKAAPKAERVREFTRKPDADNVAKSVMDALNGTAWLDDAQVTRLTVEKLPRTRGAQERTEAMLSWPGAGEAQGDEDWSGK